MEAVHGYLSRRGPTAVDAGDPADRGWGQPGAVLRATAATATVVVVVTTVVAAEYAKHLGAPALTISARLEFGELETADNAPEHAHAADVGAEPAPEVCQPATRTVTSA